MGLPTLLKLAVALLAAAGLSVFLIAGISADDGNEEAVAARALQPTEVVTEIPEGYNELFELQWGGGSLYQLKGRLATMGCMANTIWLYDNSKWNVYNQYTISQDNPVIQQFLQQYEQFIPAGTLWTDCYRICEFKYVDDVQRKECRTFTYTQERNFFNVPPYPIDNTALCTTNFNPIVQEKVLPILPLHPETCVIRQQHTKVRGYYINFFITYNKYNKAYPIGLPITIIYAPENLYALPNAFYNNTQQTNSERIINEEIHELCHINQHWHIAQALQIDTPLTVYSGDLWYETPAGREFITLTGFKNTNKTWTLPQNSVYRNIYSINPKELSAELCMSYIVESIGVENSYKSWIWRNNRFVQQSFPNFNINTYLTPQIREWLETYMILPDVSE